MACPRRAWDTLQFALRLGSLPQCVITTTPRAIPVLKKIMGDQATITSRSRTADNANYLAPAFLAEIAAPLRRHPPRPPGAGRRDPRGRRAAPVEARKIDASRLAGPPRARAHRRGRRPAGLLHQRLRQLRHHRRRTRRRQARLRPRRPHIRAATPPPGPGPRSPPTTTTRPTPSSAETNQGGDLMVAAFRSSDGRVPVKKVHATAASTCAPSRSPRSTTGPRAPRRGVRRARGPDVRLRRRRSLTRPQPRPPRRPGLGPHRADARRPPPPAPALHVTKPERNARAVILGLACTGEGRCPEDPLRHTPTRNPKAPSHARAATLRPRLAVPHARPPRACPSPPRRFPLPLAGRGQGWGESRRNRRGTPAANWNATTHTKASRIGPLLAFEALRAPVWAPRDYATFARRGLRRQRHRLPLRAHGVRGRRQRAAPPYQGPHEIEQHPLLDLIARPNPVSSAPDLLEVPGTASCSSPATPTSRPSPSTAACASCTRCVPTA